LFRSFRRTILDVIRKEEVKRIKSETAAAAEDTPPPSAPLSSTSAGFTDDVASDLVAVPASFDADAAGDSDDEQGGKTQQKDDEGEDSDDSAEIIEPVKPAVSKPGTYACMPVFAVSHSNVLLPYTHTHVHLHILRLCVPSC